ncbi:MAG: hypothetical protein WEH44_08655, partial [Pirellulaceae bacterium]
SAAAATGKKGYLRLEQWYDRYQEALLDGRGEQAINDLARYWMQLVANSQSPHALDTSRLLPLIRSRFDFSVTALRAEAAGQGDVAASFDQLAWKPLADHLAIVLTEGSQQTAQYVTHAQLTSAGLTWPAALALAMQNLRRVEPALAQPMPFVASQGNTWVPATRQSPHTAAALLWPEWCRNLPVAGQSVAFAPFANTLAITGSGNHAELAQLAATALALAKTMADKPLSSVPLVLEGNEWRPWLPPPSHPVHPAIRELWMLHENSLYAEQAKLLKQKLEGQDDAPYVASYKVMALSSPTGQRTCSTVTLWTETLATLLPQADAVVLTKLLNRAELDADENADPKLGERITVGWPDLANYLGDQLQPQGMYPERYLVSGDAFPVASAWDRLAQLRGNITPTPAPPAAPAAFAPPVPPIASAPQPVPASPQWQPTMPVSKIPLAPRRPPLWPVILAVAIPVGFLFVLFLGVSLLIYSRWSAGRTAVAQPMGNMAAPNHFPMPQPVLNPPAGFRLPPANVQPPAPRPPQYIVKLPWTEIEEFPPLGKPEAPLPRLAIDKQDVLLSGRPLREGHHTFRDDVPEGGWLVGLRIVRGFNWGGAIRALQPIYQVEGEYQLGKLCGSPGGAAQTQVLAKPGYAIGRIESRAGLVNNAVRLTFFKVKDQGLDIDDSYTTQWLGSEGGGDMPAIGGRGDLIVGLGGSYHPD